MGMSSVSANGRQTSGRIIEIDGLRGIAIFLVILWHYFAIQTPARHGSLLAAALVSLRLTWSGVDLFFVLSGFLIGGILLDVRESTNYFSTFYRRRFFRIVPLYAVLGVLYGTALRSGGRSWGGTSGHWLFDSPIPWPAFPLFLQNVAMSVRGSFDPLVLGVTWSLAVEEQFYLTLPLLVRFVPRRRLVPVLVAIAMLAPLWRTLALCFLPRGGIVGYVSMPMRADSLLAGVFAAILIRTNDAWAMVERRRGWIKIAVLVLAAAGLCAMALNATRIGSPLMSTVGYSGIALFYALVLLLALSGPRGRLGRFLRGRWLGALGEIAYGTYLLHVAIIGICFGLIFGSAPRVTTFTEFGVTLLALAVTVVIAKASWTFFEKRMMVVGKRYSYDAPPEARSAARQPDREAPALGVARLLDDCSSPSLEAS
jgi:peptidoglycan/LPS O-acetylase OafA/YrhL